MRFVFPHSHAFPGGRVVVDDDAKDGAECLVEFGDGITVIAEWASRKRCHSSVRPHLSHGEGHAGGSAALAPDPGRGPRVEVAARAVNYDTSSDGRDKASWWCRIVPVNATIKIKLNC